MRYESLRRRLKHFQAFTGLKVEEFDRLAASIQTDWEAARIRRLQEKNPERKRKLGGGRKPILENLEDRLLLTILWAKLYPAYIALEYLFGIDESTVSRTIKETTPILKGKFVFQDPRKSGKKKIASIEELRKLIPDLDDVLVDATEQPIPRPGKKRQRSQYHSGKKKRFTVKTQIASTREGLIVNLSRASPGRHHDYKLFKSSLLPQIIPKTAKLYGDSGYQGIQKDFPKLHSVIPFKRSKNHSLLTRSEKIMNTKQRRIRVKIEHVISRLKKYRVLSEVYRHSLRNYDQTFEFVANIVNFRMLQRLQTA